MFILADENYKPTDSVNKTSQFYELTKYSELKNMDSIDFGDGYFFSVKGILLKNLGEYSIIKWLDTQLKNSNYHHNNLPKILVTCIKICEELSENTGFCYSLRSIIHTYKYWYKRCISYYDTLPEKLLAYEIFINYFKFMDGKNNTAFKKLIFLLYTHDTKNKKKFILSDEYLEIYQEIKLSFALGRFNGIRIKCIDIYKYTIAKWLSHSLSNNKISLTWDNPKIPYILKAAAETNKWVEHGKNQLLEYVVCVDSLIKIYDDIWSKCDDYLLEVIARHDNTKPSIIYVWGLFVSGLSVHITELYEKWEEIMKNKDVCMDIELELFKNYSLPDN